MKRIWNLLRNNRFVENTNWLIFQNIYSMMLSLVVGALSARYPGSIELWTDWIWNVSGEFIYIHKPAWTDSILMNEMVCHPEKKRNDYGNSPLHEAGCFNN